MVEQFPPGLAPLLQARGFGPAGVQALYTATGAASLDDLERAAMDGLLAQVLGPKRADDLIAQFPVLRNPVRSLRLKSAFETAHLLLEQIRDGAARRTIVLEPRLIPRRSTLGASWSGANVEDSPSYEAAV